jgi:chromosome partitioning protein
VLIPLQPHFLALHGMGKLLETTALVAKRINPALKVTGIILSLYESSARLSREVVQELVEFFDRARGSNTPWAKARIFSTRIRRNIKLAECPSFGQSIFSYSPHCNGAEDYAALAREILGEQPPTVLAARVELDERGQVSVLSVERSNGLDPARAQAVPEAHPALDASAARPG